MGLFNKKPKTAEDILKLIKELPEEEMDKLSDMLLEDEGHGFSKKENEIAVYQKILSFFSQFATSKVKA